jgi:hypothetical protein
MEMKQMPYEEKYRGILDEMKMCKGFVLPIVEKELGVQKAAEPRVTVRVGGLGCLKVNL